MAGMDQTPNAPTKTEASTQPVLTLAQITDQLNWPRLLRIGAMAFAPSRLAIGLFTVVLIGLLNALSRLWTEGAGTISVAADGFAAAIARLAHSIWDLNGASAGQALAEIGAGVPGRLLGGDWNDVVGAIVLIPVALAILLLGLLAICRSAGMELSRRELMSWPATLAYARQHAGSMLVAALAPIAVIIAITLVAMGLGLLLSNGVTSVVGVMLLGFVYLLGALAVLAVLGLVIGVGLMPASIACEGTDGLDAVSRVFNYLKERPLRLALYTIVAGASALVAVGVLTALLVGGTLLVNSGTTPTDFNDGAAYVDRMAMATQAAARGLEAEEFSGWSRFWVSLWDDLFGLLIYGLTVSAIGCAGTGIYLAMRRLCDGQEFGEIWTGSAPAGVMTPGDAPLTGGDRVGSRIDRQPEANQD